ERHIRYDDVRNLKSVVTTELNVEGNPTPDFVALCREVRPGQVTLVPDAPDAITSNAGWDVVAHQGFLRDTVAELQSYGCRVSIFLDPDPALVDAAAVQPYRATAQAAVAAGLGLNAGHDLDLENLAYLALELPGLQEVSIGHALVADALYLGLENTVQLYLRQLK
ncbi:MAG: pyridoxine 5'-phosphate synthase, partial [Hymenobacter sp.]